MRGQRPVARSLTGPVRHDPAAEQAEAAVGVVRRALREAEIVAIYLYGSAVVGGLRPDSDLDLFVVADRSLRRQEKVSLVEGLMPISDRETRPAGCRPIELTVAAQPEVRPWRYPPRMELQYGEWLRAELLAGRGEPQPPENPDLAVLMTMVRQSGRALVGPPATDVLDAVPGPDLVRAMVDGLPSLMADLADDTRNVLLTLARIWVTVETGDILPKDGAADWAIERLPGALRPTLMRARDLYRVGGYGHPWEVGAQALAEHLVARIQAAVRGDP